MKIVTLKDYEDNYVFFNDRDLVEKFGLDFDIYQSFNDRYQEKYLHVMQYSTYTHIQKIKKIYLNHFLKTSEKFLDLKLS